MKPRHRQIATSTVSASAPCSVQSAPIRPSTSVPAPFVCADAYFSNFSDRSRRNARSGISARLRPVLTRSLFSLILALPFLHVSSFISTFAQNPADKAESRALPSLRTTETLPRPQEVFAQEEFRSRRADNQREAETAQTPEAFAYLRLSDLTSERNTQYTYTPARFDMRRLRAHLRYPDAALREGREAAIDVVAYIDAEGRITRVNYIGEQNSAQNDFAKNACDAVKQCAFTPAYRNGQPVHSVVVIPVKFVL